MAVHENTSHTKTATFWNNEIIKSSRVEKDWRLRGNEVVSKFRNEARQLQSFNILYSNTQTIKPAVYSATPKPDVRPRYKIVAEPDADPQTQQQQEQRGKTADDVSEVLERALIFAIDSYDFDRTMEAVVDDMLIPGRGIARVRYEPTVEEQTQEREEQTLDEFGEEAVEIVEETIDTIVDQEVICEYVYWEDFRMGSARNWVDVPWIGFRHKFTKDQWIEDFGNEFVEEADFSFSVNDDTDETSRGSKTTDRRTDDNLAIVWEIWDKETREIKWISSGISSFIEEDEDPLNLVDFFPVPEPLYAVETTNTTVPIPLFDIYKALADELNIVQTRILKLTNALKLRGIYPANMDEIQQLLQLDDNKMIGVTDFTVFDGGARLENLIMFAPIEEIARVIVILTAQRESIKQTIFEVTGISDILRGATKASETLGAQQIKAQFGASRMEILLKRVRIFARDIIRMKGEIIAEKYTPELLQLMTGKVVTPEMTEMMESDILRSFNIDIETDSTVAIDRAGEKAEMTELLTGIVTYLQGIAPIVQSGVMSIDVAKDILLASVSTFSNGRAVTDAIERIGEPPPQGEQLPPGAQPGAVSGQGVPVG